MIELSGKHDLERARIKQIEERLKKNEEDAKKLKKAEGEALDRAKEIANVERQLLEAKFKQEAREKAIAAAQEEERGREDLNRAQSGARIIAREE